MVYLFKPNFSKLLKISKKPGLESNKWGFMLYKPRTFFDKLSEAERDNTTRLMKIADIIKA